MYRSRYIRLFVSSTFEDMQIERDILQNKVFPRISALCESRGWQFEDIDLRWGVSQEASRKQKTMQICLNEIKRCQELSPKPNFLILQGDRYGWIPIPETIPYARAMNILPELNAKERELFDAWYILDRNVLDKGEYILCERTGRYLDYNVYVNEAEEPLRKIFKRFGYTASATEQEIIAGLYDTDDARRHVMLYSRHLTDVPAEVADVYDDAPKAFFGLVKAKGRLKDLKEELKRVIDNKKERTLPYKAMFTEKYAEEFESAIYSMLEVIVLNEINAYQDISELQMERERNRVFVGKRTSFFIGRESFIDEICSRIDRRSNVPIVVTGEPGCGKSSILAKIVERYSPSMNVIARFVGNTFIKSFGHELLKSIWDEMDEYAPTEKKCSESEFSIRLSTAKVDKPLLIVIDGLDQTQGSHACELSEWMWLPKKCADNVMVVCSVAREENSVFWQIRKGLDVLKLGGMDEADALRFMDMKLAQKSRTLTLGQKSLVRPYILSSARQPMYLTLLSHYLLSLHSYDPVDESILGDSSRLFEHMLDYMASSDHGDDTVRMVMSLITQSKYGMSQNELREILALDEDFWNALMGSSHYKIKNRLVPSVLIIRLLNDLEPFLYYQSAFDKILISLNHKTLHKYVGNWLRGRKGYGLRVAELMYGYFTDKWRKGDVHAIYEIPSKALDKHDFQLFRNLDYTIMKIWKDASDNLRSIAVLAMAFAGEGQESDDLYNYMMFDAEACGYARAHGCASFEDVEHAVSGLAAGWRKESAVRKAFEDSKASYPSMVNTIANKTVYERMFMTLPFEVNDSAVIADDPLTMEKSSNLVIWNNNGYLYMYVPSTCRSYPIMPEHMIDDFKISDDFMDIVAVSGMNLIVFDRSKNKVRSNVCLEKYVNAFNDLCIHKRTDGGLVIAFKDDVNLYILKCAVEGNMTISTYPRKTISTDKIVGFLKDGNWIVLKVEGEIQENGKTLKVRDVNAYDLTNGFEFKGGCRHIVTSASNWEDVPASASGNNLVISSSSNDIAVCDYSGEKMQMRNVHLFNQWGRLSTYALHVSADERSFWAISGDTRLAGFNLKTGMTEYIVNMPCELAMFKASPNNTNLLLSLDDKGRETLVTGRRYGTMMRVGRFPFAADYFPSLLTTLSACPSGFNIAASHGADPQLNAEGATMFYINPRTFDFERFHYDDPSTMKAFFSMSTAISRDGKRFVYAKGPLVELCDDSTKHLYHIPPRTDGVQIKWPNRDVWSYISRMEYTPDSSAILALSGRSNLGHSSQDGFLFVTGGADKGYLKHVIDLPKDLEYVSFAYSNISANGAYALLWSGNHVASGYLGILVDLRNNKIISRMPSTIGLKFYPDSKAFVETIITKITRAKRLFAPDTFEFAAGMSDCVSEKSAERQRAYKYPDTEVGDIAASGKFAVLIEHTPGKGSRIFFTFDPGKGLAFDEYVHACRITYDDLYAFVICDTVVYLVALANMEMLQEFRMYYPNDTESRAHARLFVSHHIDKRDVAGKKEHVHNSRHFQLYSKGLLISDWDRIFRIEPDGIVLNAVSYATISRVWNHRTEEFDVPKAQCPKCGHRFAPDSNVIDCIERICKDLKPDQSPCLCLRPSAWEAPELQGHKCPYCSSRLRFNPFIG